MTTEEFLKILSNDHFIKINYMIVINGMYNLYINPKGQIKFGKLLEKSTLIESYEEVLKIITVDDAVYVDAGFKNGKSKIAVVKPGKDILIKTIQADSAIDAEKQAVQFALEQYKNETIYTDCKSAVICDRVKWIPRMLNKAADAFANLRTGVDL
jgi:hypothetical protein